MTPVSRDIAESVSEELNLLLENLGNPKVVTLDMLNNGCVEHGLFPFFSHTSARAILLKMGFEKANNPNSIRGLWDVRGRKIVIYARSDLERGEVFKAIKQLVIRERENAVNKI